MQLTIEQPWSRATPAGAKVGGGYLRVTNAGKEADRLVGGTFPLAGKVELHEMSMADNVMRMKQVPDGLEIKPGETVELKPGGYHLMFMDLRDGLKDGQSIKGTLVFEKAGSVEVEYVVRSMSGEGGPLRPISITRANPVLTDQNRLCLLIAFSSRELVTASLENALLRKTP